ncbi:MAG: hypothetical protein AAGI92_09330 [Pseudomonadota bacterium]
MLKAIKYSSVAAAFTGVLLVSNTAAADYVIMEDTSLPSVLFFEFEEPAADIEVINAPFTNASVLTTAPATPDAGLQEPPPGARVGAPAPVTIDQRASELENMSNPQLRQRTEQSIVDDAVLRNVPLR